ncbi:hypothetical protein K469DRAFT_681634 [Zopfia rhizophila CBS 207.26]|uniref:Transcription factor TFIIIC triple barrel domain-containing protein n=1 Tax=Zopfia rhizophila CBS 207.26 TaxID=1314779 RepID=A0A6A6EWB7_9PEZI|nr:hypothetical protein K469DRAFT_681634 [Zopfia rhizophila CBS 207.26]
MAKPEENEWEYEYDDDETEDFYFSLDVSSLPDRDLSLNPNNAYSSSSNGHPDDQGPAAGELQIIGLHTPNPLVMYDGQLLSCKWASTIGTDLFFVKPNADSAHKLLRSLPSIDLLAMSSTKLTATAARLRPSDSLFSREDANEEATADPMDVSEDAQGEPTEGRAPPTDFISRLNAAKAKRGEKSRVVVDNTSNGPVLRVERGSKRHPTASRAASQQTVTTAVDEAMERGAQPPNRAVTVSMSGGQPDFLYTDKSSKSSASLCQALPKRPTMSSHMLPTHPKPGRIRTDRLSVNIVSEQQFDTMCLCPHLYMLFEPATLPERPLENFRNKKCKEENIPSADLEESIEMLKSQGHYDGRDDRLAELDERDYHRVIRRRQLQRLQGIMPGILPNKHDGLGRTRGH